MKTIAIMQPTYLPWAGYFDMIDRVDEFVYFDDVLVLKRSWGVRNRIRTAQGEQFLTVPLVKNEDRDRRRFDNTRILYDGKWTDRHLEAVRRSYAKAPFGREVVDLLASVYAATPVTIGGLNISLIERFCESLGISTPRIQASTLDETDGTKDDRLVSICEALRADRYLSAQGSAAYIEAGLPQGAFAGSPVDLVYHQFEHPIYRQTGEGFLSHMAIVDIIANCGTSHAMALIRAGRRKEISSSEMRLKLGKPEIINGN